MDARVKPWHDDKGDGAALEAPSPPFPSSIRFAAAFPQKGGKVGGAAPYVLSYVRSAPNFSYSGRRSCPATAL